MYYFLTQRFALTISIQFYCTNTVTTFVVSAIVSHGHKLDMVHIQNSTLAGGVAIGSVCNLLVGPHGALLIGSVSAIISVFGYRYLTVSSHFIWLYSTPHSQQCDFNRLLRDSFFIYQNFKEHFSPPPLLSRSIWKQFNFTSITFNICFSCSRGVWLKILASAVFQYEKQFS